MRVLKTMIWLILLLSATAFAADAGSKGGKRVDVDPVDVPEKMVVEPTSEEIHDDTMNTRTCGSCHSQGGDFKAEPKPLTHFFTTKDCVACHFTKSWVPLRFYSHLSGKFPAMLRDSHRLPNPMPDSQDCANCHFSNNEFLAK